MQNHWETIRKPKIGRGPTIKNKQKDTKSIINPCKTIGNHKKPKIWRGLTIKTIAKPYQNHGKSKENRRIGRGIKIKPQNIKIMRKPCETKGDHKKTEDRARADG